MIFSKISKVAMLSVRENMVKVVVRCGGVRGFLVTKEHEEDCDEGSSVRWWRLRIH